MWNPANLVYCQEQYFSNKDASEFQKYLINNSIGGSCCCGGYSPMSFPNLNFEDGPQPPPNAFYTYAAGTPFGGWTVTRATIDLVDGVFGGLGNGNPNGASTFVDLHGSPGFGAISYLLTGLTAGNNYRIEFWTAQNGDGFSSTGTLTVAGGSWLNVSWTVSVSGSTAWFKQVYEFMAMGTSANMEFSSSGPRNFQGVLIDDIVVSECPADQEPPNILNEPEDETYSCLKDVPKPPALELEDECDINPFSNLKISTEDISPCEKVITRTWTVSDHCNNSKLYEQRIYIKDDEPPFLTKDPNDRIISCKLHSRSEFLKWIGTNAGAALSDNCSMVRVTSSFDSIPLYGCDTSIVDFEATDDCGNIFNFSAKYIILDSLAPQIILPAHDVLLRCSSSARDSLKKWLIQNGGAIASDECSLFRWKNNFGGDSSALEIPVEFSATDQCGNVVRTKAVFRQSDGADTFYLKKYLCNFQGTRKDTFNFELPGCDSVLVQEIIGIPPPDTAFVYNLTCDPKQNLREEMILQSYLGCDSVVVKLFTLLKPDTTILYKTNCSISDTLIDQKNLKGSKCDSIVIEITFPVKSNLELRLNYTCDSSKLGIDTLNYFNQFGCDSIIIFETRFSGILISHRDSIVCGLLNSYTDSMRIRSGTCDSIVVTKYIGLEPDTLRIYEQTCDILLEGIKINYLVNQYGCDSLIITDTKFQKSDTSKFIDYVCQKSEEGLDTMYFGRNQECDSVVIVEKKYKSLDTTLVNRTTCIAAEAGLKYYYLKGRYCDSVVVVNYQYFPEIIISLTKYTCSKDSVRSDTIRDKSSSGCDSLHILKYIYQSLEFEVMIIDASCSGKEDGIIELIPKEIGFSGWQLMINGELQTDLKKDFLKSGLYEVQVIDPNGCVFDRGKLSIGEGLKLEVNAGSDQLIKGEQNVLIYGQTNRPVVFWSWHPAEKFQCSDCASSIAKFKDSTLVWVQVRDTQGCEAYDSLWIFVFRDFKVYVPNVFSPNGDQINDHFFIFGDDAIELKELKIYDRWGELIFKVKDGKLNRPDYGWDGRFQGNQLNPGVYIYMATIALGGLEEVLYGEFTLLR